VARELGKRPHLTIMASDLTDEIITVTGREGGRGWSSSGMRAVCQTTVA
jgi:hypothetical protein